MTPIERVRAVLAAGTPGPVEFSDTTDVRGHKGEFRAPSPYNGFMLVGRWIDDADPRKLALAVNLAPAFVALWAGVEEYLALAKPTGFGTLPIISTTPLNEALAALNDAATREVGA